jgi:hypothetical protein
MGLVSSAPNPRYVRLLSAEHRPPAHRRCQCCLLAAALFCALRCRSSAGGTGCTTASELLRMHLLLTTACAAVLAALGLVAGR